MVISSGFNQVGFTENKNIVDLVILLVLTNLVLPCLYHGNIFWKKTLKNFENLVDYGYNQPGDLKNRGNNHGYYLGLTTVIPWFYHGKTNLVMLLEITRFFSWFYHGYYHGNLVLPWFNRG